MRLLNKICLITVCLAVWDLWAADGALSDSIFADQNLDTARNNTLGNVDVFGQSAIGSIYILWDNVDLAIEIKKSIQEKSFATDEFFMQNVDREEFEEERNLRLFQEDRSKYFRLFPDAHLYDDDDDDDD
ncbi:MAG TPA: hypothetical protein VLM37_12645 [Fibrobacteraceae bacterium]|nr:hypothetical protein [Fibrobacteraceae bacterium]